MATEMDTSIWKPIVMSLVSGGATGIGGLLVLWGPFSNPTDGSISFALAFAAGVMTVVSVCELWLPFVQASMSAAISATMYLGVGFAATKLLSLLPVPDPETVATDFFRGVGTNALVSLDGTKQHVASKRVSAWRLGFVLATVLTIHNFPEGMLVGLGVVKSPELGLALCIAIMMHNVAEGFVVAVPTLAGTGSKRIALALTCISGMSEPLGAALGVMFMRTWFSAVMESAINAALCIVGGVMIGVSFMELLPQAARFGLTGERNAMHAYAKMLLAFCAGGVAMGMTIAFV